MSYTPGPWKIGTPGPNGCPTIGTKNGLMTAMIAHSLYHPDQSPQASGNANLIAAAPDLLAALKGIVDLSVQVICESTADKAALEAALNNAHAVIAKAEGKS